MKKGSKGPSRTLSNVIKVQGSASLRKVTAELQQQGFIPAPMPNDFGRTDGKQPTVGPSWEEYVHAQICTGGSMGKSFPSLHLSSGVEVPEERCGTKGLGYMAWGADNRNPNMVSLLTEASPYTASAHRFNTDLSVGRGPHPVYAYVQYVGGNITEKQIPFNAAGTLIKGWIRDLRRELLQAQASAADGANNGANGGANGDGIVSGGFPAGDTNPLIADIKEQIAALEKDYATWEDTRDFLYGNINKGEPGFLSRNNIFLTSLALAQDLQQNYHCFPELCVNKRQLDKNGKKVPTSMWTPRITGIRYRSAHVSRLERSDRNGRINYVYISNAWLDQTGIVRQEDYEIHAMPALDIQAPAADLERLIRETRQRNGSVRSRPTRFILPVRYPTPGRPYYSVPASQSIYSGDIYEYLMTMISDRNKRRKNSNVIGRIIYLNAEYMERLYFQKKADTEADKMKVFTELRGQINKFLADRDNVGKPLVAYTFTGQDGKVYESWKIVEIESADKGSVEANQKELAEVSSIVFFAFGLDSRLVGNTPGDVASASGGTELRERYMLKQLQMSPMQQLLLSPLYVVKDFNHLDTHLEWVIPREALTTYAENKSGIASVPQPTT